VDSPALFPAVDEFEQWYSHYPRKVGKVDARKAWLKIERGVSLETLIAETIRWDNSQEWRDLQFVPYPATFLRRRMWEDESLPYRASREDLVRAEANVGAGPR
jgi:hypothetical protein